jgi:hypothetical protein
MRMHHADPGRAWLGDAGKAFVGNSNGRGRSRRRRDRPGSCPTHHASGTGETTALAPADDVPLA